jgi:hypothetical protein
MVVHSIYGQDTLTIKQKKLLKTLQNYRMIDREEGKYSHDIYLYDYQNSVLYTAEDYHHPLIKKEILRLLDSKWTEREIEARVTYYALSNSNEVLVERANNILKKSPKRVFKQVCDSLVFSWNEVTKQEFQVKPAETDTEIIKKAGYLYLEEGISLLKLYDKREEASLALARMEVEPYYSNALREYDPENIIKKSDSVYSGVINHNIVTLRYIGTQAALQKIEKWFYMDEKKVRNTDNRYDRPHYQYIPKETLYLIGNSERFPDLKKYVRKDEETKKRFFSVRYRSLKDEDLNYFKKYFKENKGNIKVDDFPINWLKN